MTTATVKLVLRRDKRKADGTSPVWLRITANRKSRYISTGIYLEPRHWNETKRLVRASHPIAPALNARLQDVLLEASRQALETPSADAVKTSLNGTGGSLVSYFQGFIDDLDTAGRFGDWKKYRTPQDLKVSRRSLMRMRPQSALTGPGTAKVSQVSPYQVPAQPHLAFHKGQRVRTPEGDGEVLQYFRDRITVRLGERAALFVPGAVTPLEEAPF